MVPFTAAGSLCGWIIYLLAVRTVHRNLSRNFVTNPWLPLPCALLTGTASFFIYSKTGSSSGCITDLLAVCFALFHALTDLENGYIYDRAVIASLVIAAVFRISVEGTYGMRELVLGACAGAVPPALLSLVIRGAIGTGDILLMCGIGALTGWKAALFIMYFSLIIGGFYAAALLLSGHVHARTELPFAPFVLCGTLCVIVFRLTPYTCISYIVNQIN